MRAEQRRKEQRKAERREGEGRGRRGERRGGEKERERKTKKRRKGREKARRDTDWCTRMGYLRVRPWSAGLRPKGMGVNRVRHPKIGLFGILSILSW